jgi:hypothetical protein
MCFLFAALQFFLLHEAASVSHPSQDSEAPRVVENGTREQQSSEGEKVSSTAPRRRISFKLHRDLTYNNTFNPTVQCQLGKKAGFSGQGERRNWYDRLGLPLELQAKGVLDFVTTVSTDLKIMYMGDSVAIQFAQGMEEAAGASFAQRTVLRAAWGEGHENNAVSAPVRGGGVVASWRVTAMLSRRAEGGPLPNAPGGGWLREDAVRLLNYSYSSNMSASAPITTVGSMDALIFRVMHGWIPFEEITAQALEETVELAHELLGVKTIIFVTVPFSNNVRTEQELRDMHRTNNIIRTFCNEWISVENGVHHVLVQEYGNFTHELIERHARAIGMNTSVDNDSYMLLRLKTRPALRFPASVAHACATLPRGRNPTCDRNYVTRDGMHPCMETVGTRLIASIACLLACVYNHNDQLLDTNPDASFVRRCGEDCNKRFMTLKPVGESIIEDGNRVFSMWHTK